MNDLQIDRILGQTPCLCGNLLTWHPECYKGKSGHDVSLAYQIVYDSIRRALAKDRNRTLRNLLLRAQRSPTTRRAKDK
jgi:hypothetical protein